MPGKTGLHREEECKLHDSFHAVYSRYYCTSLLSLPAQQVTQIAETIANVILLSIHLQTVFCLLSLSPDTKYTGGHSLKGPAVAGTTVPLNHFIQP